MSSATLTVGGQTLSTVELQKRRAETERFIEQSGDGQAIRELGRLRRHPDDWFAQLKAAATSQTTLKVALGVFLGVVAAELALSALRSDALQALIANIDTRMDLEPIAATPAETAGHLQLDETAIDSAADPTFSSVDDGSDLDLGDVIDDLLG